MQTSPQTTTVPRHVTNADRNADRVYEGLTIAAMLLLLVSLWVF